MKKICLAVLFCFMAALPARADRHGMYVRIECNNSMGLLDISYELIAGTQIGNFFYNGKEYYQYTLQEEDKKVADITILSGYMLQAPYSYHCELAPNQNFDIKVERIHPEYMNSGSFSVNVVEHQTDLKTKEVKSKVLLDKVIIGAGGKSSRIFIAARGDNLGTNITFEQGHLVAYFIEAENEDGITEQTIKEYIKSNSSNQDEEDEED